MLPRQITTALIALLIALTGSSSQALAQEEDSQQGFLSELLASESNNTTGQRNDQSKLNNSAKTKDFTNSVMLRGLNKITAKTSNFSLSFGETTKFGNLVIFMESCWKAPPEELPESIALLNITEQVPGESEKQVFHGWMLASTPAVSSLEHPVYDIAVIECLNQKIPSEEENSDNSPTN